MVRTAHHETVGPTHPWVGPRLRAGARFDFAHRPRAKSRGSPGPTFPVVRPICKGGLAETWSARNRTVHKTQNEYFILNPSNDRTVSGEAKKQSSEDD